MQKEMYTIQPEDYPQRLREIEDVPDKLHARGSGFPESKRYLCVVGSRKYTDYGKSVCEQVISELAGYDICIVSGLALGIDAIAHKAALAANLDCVAVPGSGLNEDVLYPRTNLPLAKNILAAGGTLISEFEPDQGGASWTFPQRNRIMAGLAHAALVVEATEESGTLITARLATEFNRDIFTIPGSIKSASRVGPHQLIRDGAALIRSGEDIAQELGLETLAKNTRADAVDLSDDEQLVVDALSEPTQKDDLIAQVDLPANRVNVLLSQIELKGVIQESGGKIEKA
jgi:DNA processing protein